MSDEIASLYVTVGADTSDFQKGMNDVRTGSQQAAAQMNDLGDSVAETENAFDNAGNTVGNFTSGINDAVGQVANFVGGLMQGAGVIGAAGGMISQLVTAGEKVDLVTQGLNAMTNGHADDYLNAMSAATHGVVTNMDLATAATQALSTGVVSSSADMARLAADGAALGRVFMGGDASAGIQTLTRDLEAVGNTRGLKVLGIDATEVKQRFDELKATGMADSAAWTQAVMESADAIKAKLGDTFDTAGSSLDKFQVGWSNAWDTMTSIAAGTFEAGLVGLDKLTSGLHDFFAAVAAHPDVAAGNILGTGDTDYRNNKPGTDSKTSRMDWLYNPDYNTAGQGDYQYATGNYINHSNDPYYLSNNGGNFGPVATQSDATYGPVATTSDASYGAVTGGMNQGQINANQMTAGQLNQESLAAARHEQLTGTDSFQGQTQLTANLNTQLGKLQEIKDTEAGAALAAGQRAAAEDKTRAAIEAQSVAQRLGVQGNNLASDAGSGMQSSIQAGRDALAQRDKGDLKKQAADLAAYDTQSKTTWDNYRLSTGLATQSSIKFEDMQAQLTAGLQSGSIGVEAYGQQMLALEKMVESGTTSLDDFNKAQFDVMAAMKDRTKLQTDTGKQASDAGNVAPAMRTTGARGLNQQGSQGDQSGTGWAATSKGVDDVQQKVNAFSTAAMDKAAWGKDGVVTADGALKNFQSDANIFSTDHLNSQDWGHTPLTNNVTTLTGYQAQVNGFSTSNMDGQKYGLPGIDPAATRAEAELKTLETMEKHGAYVITVVTNTYGSAPVLPARAGGGAVAAGQAYMVGEAGSEMFVPSTNGTIVPHGQLTSASSSRGGGGSGSPTINIQNLQLVGIQDTKQLLDGLQKEARNRGQLLTWKA